MALSTRARAGHCDLERPTRRADPPFRRRLAGQYTAIRYAERLSDAGALASIGTVGGSYDSAMAESVIWLYKTECVRQDGPFRTVDDLELATLSWVHWFNTNRLHSALDYLTPIEYEEQYYRQINPRQQPLPGEPALHQTRGGSVSNGSGSVALAALESELGPSLGQAVPVEHDQEA